MIFLYLGCANSFRMFFGKALEHFLFVMSFHFGDETGYKEYMNISTILLAEKSE